MPDSYHAAIERHRARRWEAYAETRAQAIADGSAGAELRLVDIDRRALEVWKRTWSGAHRSRAGRWDWSALIERQPRRAAILPFAIWHRDDLCGLVLGHASRRNANGIRHTITLAYVERRPEPPEVPLRRKVMQLAVAAAENYGVAVGASRLRLHSPDPNLLAYYKELGFEAVWKGRNPLYCEREIL